MEKGGPSPGYYVVCEYDPAGNVLGNFKANVQVQESGGGCARCSGGVFASWGGGVLWGVVVVGLVGGLEWL